MGTRLYPNTKDAAKLEKLAGVPEGTMRALQLWEEMQTVYWNHIGISKYDDDDKGYDMWTIAHNSDVGTLEGFLLNGWGKFDLSLIPLDEDGGEESRICGDANGSLAVQLLMSSSAFEYMDCKDILKVFDLVVESEGVHWS